MSVQKIHFDIGAVLKQVLAKKKFTKEDIDRIILLVKAEELQ